MNRRSGFKIMSELIGLVKPLAGYMIFAVLMGLAGHLCASFITISGGYALLNLTGINTQFTLKAVFIFAAVCALLRGILRYGEQACNHFIAFKLLALIRDKVFQKLRKLCPAKLEGKDRGNLISVITADIELLEVFYAHTISPSAIAFLFTIIMCLFIGSFHYLLGIAALCAYITVGIIIPFIISKISGKYGMQFREESGNLSGYMLGSLRGLSETIQYNAGKERLRGIEERTEKLSGAEKKMKNFTAANQAVTNTAILTADAIMLFLSAWLYRKGKVDFSGVLIPVTALFSSFGPAVALANLGSTLQNTFAAGNRVLDILEEDALIEETKGREKTEFKSAEAENVSFSYGDEKVLDNVSLKFEKGQITGISGKSGSGKSTLLKLFMRFWDADSGEIKISEKNIKDINTEDLRNMEGFMTQETHLFQESIKNNIKIAKLDASDEEIIKACQKASIHDFIVSLPKGYDTNVGELGDTLSGGERQRIGLARAFLHDAPFLLLDEPTSNLDSLNEGVILKSLNEESAGKTIVLVSHRESTMRIIDKVYSVENGRMS